MAKKGKFYPVRFVLSGVLWGVAYFGLIIPLLGHLFLFDFLSWEAWENKYRDFWEFHWKINNPFDGALFMCMLLWIPFFFIMWRFWFRVLKKVHIKLPTTKKPSTKKLVDLQKARQPFVPQKLPAAQVSKEYKAPVLPNQQTQQKGGTVKSHTNLAQIIKDSAALARNYKVEIFQHILLEGSRVPLAVSTDARAVLIEVVNKRGVNWSVEFSEKVEDSNWYSDGGNMEDALKDLMGASRSLAKSEPNSEVLSAVLIPSGRILNAKQTVDYLKSQGVYLLTFKDGEPKEILQTLESFLTEMFELKSGENAGKVKPIAPKKAPVTPAKQLAKPTQTVAQPAVQPATQPAVQPVAAQPAVQPVVQPAVVPVNVAPVAAAPAATPVTIPSPVGVSPTEPVVTPTILPQPLDVSLLNENVLEDVFLTDVEEMKGVSDAG